MSLTRAARQFAILVIIPFVVISVARGQIPAAVGWELVSRASLPGEPHAAAVDDGRLLITTALEGAVAVLEPLAGLVVGPVLASHLFSPAWSPEHEAAVVLAPDFETLVLGFGPPEVTPAPVGTVAARIVSSGRGPVTIHAVSGSIWMAGLGGPVKVQVSVPFTAVDLGVAFDEYGPVIWASDDRGRLWRIGSDRAVNLIGVLSADACWRLVAVAVDAAALWDGNDQLILWRGGRPAVTVIVPGTDAVAALVTDAGIKIFVATSRSLLAVDTSDGREGLRVFSPPPGRLGVLAVDAVTGYLYAVTASGEVYRHSGDPGAGTPEPPTN